MRTRRFFSLYFLFFFLLLAFIPSPAIGADAAAFNPTTVAVEAKSAGGGVPVGTIVAWPVASNPEDMDNWLECNGQAVSQTAYPELFALVGGRVPDYRGLFLRGHGSQASTHYGVVTHSSGGLGQIQGDAIRNITAAVDNFFLNSARGAFFVTGWNGDGLADTRGTVYRQRYNVQFDAARIVPTSTENRPVNRAVRYLIRAKS